MWIEHQLLMPPHSTQHANSKPPSISSFSMWMPAWSIYLTVLLSHNPACASELVSYRCCNQPCYRLNQLRLQRYLLLQLQAIEQLMAAALLLIAISECLHLEFSPVAMVLGCSAVAMMALSEWLRRAFKPLQL